MFPDELYYSAALEWGLALQAGFEYRGSGFTGVKADLGLSLFGLLVCDFFTVIYLLPRDNPFRLNLLAGIPTAAVPLSFNAAMVSFGGSVVLGYNLSDYLSLDLRLGAGFPLFFEKDKEMIRDIGFPLELWPDAVISLNFKQ
ncbi:hypothetical protein ES707_09759 [subsurface metagenome]